jgi:hypothetical protein
MLAPQSHVIQTIGRSTPASSSPGADNPAPSSVQRSWVPQTSTDVRPASSGAVLARDKIPVRTVAAGSPANWSRYTYRTRWPETISKHFGTSAQARQFHGDVFMTATSGEELAGHAGSGNASPFGPTSYRSGPRLALFTVVAELPSRVEARCHAWEALKRALAEQQEIAYEFDAHELHVWTGRPERGERCKCGARAWS